MYSSNELVYTSLIFAQSGVWPSTVQGWAALVGPTAVLFGAFIWLVNHFVISPLKASVVSVQTEARKSVRGLRRTVQTYVGKVDILADDLRECSAAGQDGAQKVAGLEARVTQVEQNFREIETELRDIRSLIEYKVLDKLNELTDGKKGNVK